MALKDWTLIEKDHHRNVKKALDLIIYKAYSEKNKNKLVWKVQVGSRVSLFDWCRNEFDTYNHAFNFAKQFMRKH